MQNAEDLSAMCHSLWTAPGSSHRCDADEHPLKLSVHQENLDSAFRLPLVFLPALEQPASLKERAILPNSSKGILKISIHPQLFLLLSLLPCDLTENSLETHVLHDPSAIRDIKCCLNLIPLQIWESFGTLGSFALPIRSVKVRFLL